VLPGVSGGAPFVEHASVLVYALRVGVSRGNFARSPGGLDLVPAGPGAYPNRRGRRDRQTDTETSVLDAAERLLEDESLHQIEVKQILAAAGVSRTSFYMYFTSKFDVVAGLLSRSLAEIFDAVQVWATDDEHQPEERLLSGLKASAAAWSEHRAVLCGAAESWAADPDLKALWTAALGRFAELFVSVVNREISLGRAHVDGDVSTIVNALVWSTERIFYLGSSGSADWLPDMDCAVEVAYRLWASTIYASGR
jgi:AcrR family transcriptional regulator